MWRQKVLSLFESSRSNREDVSNRLKVSVTVIAIDSFKLTRTSSLRSCLMLFQFLSLFVSLQPLEIGIVCRTACRIRYFMLKLYRCNVYKNVLQAKREREEWELSITNVFFCRFVQYSESSSSGACNHPMVDYTPPSYITLLFTDLGVLTPSAVSDELIKLYL